MSMRTLLGVKNHSSMKIDLFTSHHNVPFPSHSAQAINKLSLFLWRITPSASASPSLADPLSVHWSSQHHSTVVTPLYSLLKFSSFSRPEEGPVFLLLSVTTSPQCSNLPLPASSNSCWLCYCQFIHNVVLKLFKPHQPVSGEPECCWVSVVSLQCH